MIFYSFSYKVNRNSQKMNTQFRQLKPSTQHQLKRVNNFIYDLFDQIGSGYSSKVYQGKNCVDGSRVAIKVVQLSKLTNDVEKMLLANQSRALNVVNHPNILRAIHTMQTANNFYLVTHLYQQNLQNLLKLKGAFSQQEVIKFLSSMLDALCYLQASSVIHRDIKPSNIFISNGKYVLGDFGFCQFSNSKYQEKGFNVGSPMYMSPQAYRLSIYGPFSDIWALGICVLELINGGKPFSQITYDQMVKQICEIKYYRGLNISQRLKQIIDIMLEYNFEKRASAFEIQKFILQSESSFVPSLLIPSLNMESPNMSMELPGNQSIKKIKDSHRRSASVRFFQNEKQIKFKNSQKRRISPNCKNSNQQNALSPVDEKISNKSITVQHAPLTERTFNSNSKNTSFIQIPRTLPNPRLVVLEDLTNYILLDSCLIESVNKLKLLRFLAILPNVKLPKWIFLMVEQTPMDNYFNYVIQTIDSSRFLQMRHFLTFLIQNVISQYNSMGLSQKANDQNFCNRMNCLQYALTLWSIDKQAEDSNKQHPMLIEPRLLDRNKSKSTGNLVCELVFGKK